jgi:hypothetical protein
MYFTYFSPTLPYKLLEAGIPSIIVAAGLSKGLSLLRAYIRPKFPLEAIYKRPHYYPVFLTVTYCKPAPRPPRSR